MAWRSRRTRAVDLAVTQSEVARRQTDAMRAEIAALQRELAELHRQLARRDVELIDAMSRVATVTDQLRVQSDADSRHHDRLDRAIELLTILVTRSSDAPAAELGAGPTVIGGSIDPARLGDAGAPPTVDVDLTATPDPAPVPVDPGAPVGGPVLHDGGGPG